MRILDLKQGSPEWWQARAGMPTASGFDRIITPKTGKPSAQQFSYGCELIAERLMGGPPEGVESFTSKAMEYGIETEAEARAYYELETGNKVQQVGFIINDDIRAGCSPDGLVGDDGGLELKCPLPKTHVGYLLGGGLPDEYRCQVHASLLITGRSYWDFMSYAIGFPPFLVRVTPDDFTEAMREALAGFTDWLDEKWRVVKGMMPQAEPINELDEILF